MAPANIGLKQVRRLSQMPPNERIDFLAEGLPILLRSAQGLWCASQKLLDHPRAMEILIGHASEEAAKVLILMDIVRSPKKLVSSRAGPMLGWFYDHLARLLYAQAADWKPMNMADLRRRVDMSRQAHYLEGSIGEYILPNLTLYKRETQLYVDVSAFEDGNLVWTEPSGARRGKINPIFNPIPSALKVAEALSTVGAFTTEGLHIVSEVWDRTEFKDTENHHVASALTEATLRELHKKDLIAEVANESHVSALYEHWQMPMYNLDFRTINITLEELRAERDANLRSEWGGS